MSLVVGSRKYSFMSGNLTRLGIVVFLTLVTGGMIGVMVVCADDEVQGGAMQGETQELCDKTKN